MRTVDPTQWSAVEHMKASRQASRLGVRAEGLEGRLRSSLAAAAREYVRESALSKIRNISCVENVKALRYVYLFLVTALTLWGTTVMAYFWYDSQFRPPLKVQLQQSSGVTVNFPAVAICSNSVVSKKKMIKFAAYLDKVSNNKTYTLAKIQENLVKFSALVTLRIADVEMLNFMQFLYNIDPHLNITDIMYKLSPSCSALLSACRWRGRALPCDQLFATRLTPLGFCCVFNGRYHQEDLARPAKVLDLLGQNYGLSVAVLQDRDDYAVVRQPSTDGLAVLMFDGSDYPLIEGGAVRAYNVGANSSVFFQLTAHVQLVTEDLKNYSEEKRRCRLMQPRGPRWRRSYAWCLAECRGRSTGVVCDCEPFWYRPEAATVCTPEHLVCLNKHREKMIYYYPTTSSDSSLDEEVQDSLYCPECVPDCARALHSARVFQPPYYYPQKLFKNGVTKADALVNKSLLRFYYASKSHFVYRVDINYFWTEILAAAGCQSLFLVGVSLVGVAQLLFHATVCWGRHFARRTRREQARGRQPVLQ